MGPIAGTAGTSFEILLVEDNEGDVRLTREALHAAAIAIHLHVATDGEDALAFLRREGSYIYAPRPDLILLDLNLPKVDGRRVLARIKADDALKPIPIVVLTSSQVGDDIESSYQLTANCCVRKPALWYEFSALMKSIVELWLLHGRTVRVWPVW